MISLSPVKKILVLHFLIQMDMKLKSNDFTHPELAGKLSAIIESRLILSIKRKLVYALRKRFFKKRAFYGFESIIYLL